MLLMPTLAVAFKLFLIYSSQLCSSGMRYSSLGAYSESYSCCLRSEIGREGNKHEKTSRHMKDRSSGENQAIRTMIDFARTAEGDEGDAWC